jgi:hypothetical protein
MGNGIYFKIAGGGRSWYATHFCNLKCCAPTNMATVTKNKTYGKIAGFG